MATTVPHRHPTPASTPTPRLLPDASGTTAVANVAIVADDSMAALNPEVLTAGFESNADTYWDDLVARGGFGHASDAPRLVT